MADLELARQAQQQVEQSKSPITFSKQGDPYERAYAAIDAVQEELAGDPTLYETVKKEADDAYGGPHKTMRFQLDGFDAEMAEMLGKDPDINKWSDEDFKDLARMSLSIISPEYSKKVYKHLKGA